MYLLEQLTEEGMTSPVMPLPRSRTATGVTVPDVAGLEIDEALRATMTTSTSATPQPSIVLDSSAPVSFKLGPSPAKDSLPVPSPQPNVVDLINNRPGRTGDERP